jgi:thiol-disulfide isomerase/thioredoxin
VSGKKMSLADFKGKAVIVNLWATWCPPCVAELPSLDRLQGKMKDKGLVIIPISMDRGDSIAPVEKFLKKQGVMHLSLYWDKDHQIPEAWRYDGIPVSFLVAKDGHLVKKVEGNYVWDKGTMLKMAEDLSR